MILCVDVGNSKIKAGVVDGERVIGVERIATPSAPEAAAGDLELAMRRAASAVLRVDAVAIASVVPDATRAVARAAGQATGRRPLVIDHTIDLPLELAVPLPARLGVDRICAAAGALRGRRRNALVVDAGSAVTVDIVRGGRFLGGVIFAGPAVALEALARRTRQLPAIDYSAVDDPWPDSFDVTEPAMILGASVSMVGGVREAARRLEARAGAVTHRVVTGGFGEVLASGLGSGWTYEPHLTLLGIARIARGALSGEARPER